MKRSCQRSIECRRNAISVWVRSTSLANDRLQDDPVGSHKMAEPLYYKGKIPLYYKGSSTQEKRLFGPNAWRAYCMYVRTIGFYWRWRDNAEDTQKMGHLAVSMLNENSFCQTRCSHNYNTRCHQCNFRSPPRLPLYTNLYGTER